MAKLKGKPRIASRPPAVGASVKQFSSGIPHSREFWAFAMRLSSSVQFAAANHTDRPAASFISME